MLRPVRHPLLDIPGVRHGFFTREGGVSTGLYASLNCGPGSGDDPAHVSENRRRVAAHLGLDTGHLLSAHQVHSPTTVVVSGPWQGTRPHADALVTRQLGLGCGALTADCAPVLLACSQSGVVASAHAGWKGALSGVIEATVEAMVRKGAHRPALRAVVGPCIGPDSYEVSEDFAAPFLARDASAERFFRPRPGVQGKLLFDLPGYGLWRLDLAGVEHCAWSGHDTLADEARFFSNRRAHHRGEADYGRMISVIVRA
jgi:YfiH family protein